MNSAKLTAHYITPDGFDNMRMTSDGEFLTGLWFDQENEGQNEHETTDEYRTTDENTSSNLGVFEETYKWLDLYFAGKEPNFVPNYRIDNLTDFRKEVIDCMIEIPYGELITYGDIAKYIAKKRGIKRMSAQAVGQAVGWNPICIIIPCHRVMGANNALTGYGGGIKNKIALLTLEKQDLNFPS